MQTYVGVFKNMGFAFPKGDLHTHKAELSYNKRIILQLAIKSHLIFRTYSDDKIVTYYVYIGLQLHIVHELFVLRNNTLLFPLALQINCHC